MKPQSTPDNFIGHFSLNVDSKNRVIVPPLFRDILATHYEQDDNTVVVTISMEKTIAIYPRSSYNKIMETLMKKSQFNSKVRALTNAISMCASEQRIDSAGKVALSSFLISTAGIKKEVFVVGCTDHFEVWPPDKFEEYIDSNIQILPELGDTIE